MGCAFRGIQGFPPWVLIRPIGRQVSFRALARRLAAGIPINADDA